MLSELSEVLDALATRDEVALADGLADLEYVTVGTAVTFAIPLGATFDEVHRSNMTKLGENGLPVLREDGKSLKGPNYEPPRIAEILEAMRETVKRNSPT